MINIYNFILSKKYPFVIFQSINGNLNYKFLSQLDIDENDKVKLKEKWFETYSIWMFSFKVNIDNKKYISINLNSNGRIEYKNQFKKLIR